MSQNLPYLILAAWGRVDILVNNAGILRDKSFGKMELADFRLVMDVHLMGAVHCCKAVWDIMRQQQYGRIEMTTSSRPAYVTLTQGVHLGTGPDVAEQVAQSFEAISDRAHREIVPSTGAAQTHNELARAANT